MLDQPLDHIISNILTRSKWYLFTRKPRFYGFLSKYVLRRKFIQFALITAIFSLFFKFVLTEQLLQNVQEVSAETATYHQQDITHLQMEDVILATYSEPRTSQYIYTYDKKTRSDVGFVDLRVLTLEDFFGHYGSPLQQHSDEFIKSAERYGIKNWQLLPAIGMAETRGCQTGTTHQQRNCWGWGGADPTRWIFASYPQAIDVISYNMINGYTNKYLNAKDIQNTYCGLTCAQWGWRWARGVDYYVKRINDFGAKYDLERTNEITDWSSD